MKFEAKKVQIKPFVGLGAIRFKSGMVTQLPHIEYENTHDYPIAVYAELDNDSQKYLGYDVYLLSKQFIFKPKEKRIIQFEAFRKHDDMTPVFGRGAFYVTVYEIPIFDPGYVEKMIDNFVSDAIKKFKSEMERSVEESKSEVVIPKTNSEPEEKVIEESVDVSEDMDSAFTDKYCKGIKNSLYDKWVEAGRPKEVFKYERPLNASIYLNKILASSNNQ